MAADTVRAADVSKSDKNDPKDDGKRDVGRDGDTGKRTGDKIDPKQWENQKHWGDGNGGKNQ